jgi:ribosomal-protein-alanine N-acetyltransferase
MGLGTEAANVLIEYIFSSTMLHKVIACCDKMNTSSEKVMQKCGMTKEGEFRKGRLQQGQWCDELQYGILRENWLKTYKYLSIVVSKV